MSRVPQVSDFTGQERRSTAVPRPVQCRYVSRGFTGTRPDTRTIQGTPRDKLHVAASASACLSAASSKVPRTPSCAFVCMTGCCAQLSFFSQLQTAQRRGAGVTAANGQESQKINVLVGAGCETVNQLVPAVDVTTRVYCHNLLDSCWSPTSARPQQGVCFSWTTARATAGTYKALKKKGLVLRLFVIDVKTTTNWWRPQRFMSFSRSTAVPTNRFPWSLGEPALLIYALCS